MQRRSSVTLLSVSHRRVTEEARPEGHRGYPSTLASLQRVFAKSLRMLRSTVDDLDGDCVGEGVGDDIYANVCDCVSYCDGGGAGIGAVAAVDPQAVAAAVAVAIAAVVAVAAARGHSRGGRLVVAVAVAFPSASNFKSFSKSKFQNTTREVARLPNGPQEKCITI